MTEFPTPAVLSVTTGILMTDDITEVYEVLEHVLGHPIWTHQIPEARPKAAEIIAQEHPDLPQGIPKIPWTEVVAQFPSTTKLSVGG